MPPWLLQLFQKKKNLLRLFWKTHVLSPFAFVTLTETPGFTKLFAKWMRVGEDVLASGLRLGRVGQLFSITMAAIDDDGMMVGLNVVVVEWMGKS